LGDSEKECFNCHKKGHIARDCWAKGGGKEGQGPRSRQGNSGNWNRTNQATNDINDSLSDIAYFSNTRTFSAYDWVLDSATTSHISNDRNIFAEYTKLQDATVQGLGEIPARARGHGSVIVDFNVEGKNIQHRLQKVLYVPEAANSLLSVSRFDESGGTIDFRDGVCKLYT
jgi:hypothetical protein